jgi:hypothetical protein
MSSSYWKHEYSKKLVDFNKLFKILNPPIYLEDTKKRFMKKSFGMSIEILNLAGSVYVDKRDATGWPLRIVIGDAAAFKREMDPFLQQYIENHRLTQKNRYQRWSSILQFKVLEPGCAKIQHVNKNRIRDGCVLVEKQLWPEPVEDKLSLDFILNPSS